MDAPFIDASLFNIQNKGDVIDCTQTLREMVEVELRAMKVRAGQGRAAESQKPVTRQIEIENLTNSLDLLKIQESSHQAHQVRNSKLVDD